MKKMGKKNSGMKPQSTENREAHIKFWMARNALRRTVSEARAAHPDLAPHLRNTIMRTTKTLSL